MTITKTTDQHEMLMTSIANSLGVSPPIISIIHNRDNTYDIEMEEYDSDIYSAQWSIREKCTEQLRYKLSLLHQAGMIHLDFSDLNVVVRVMDDEVDVRIIDYGMSMMKEELRSLHQCGDAAIQQEVSMVDIMTKNDVYDQWLIWTSMYDNARRQGESFPSWREWRSTI